VELFRAKMMRGSGCWSSEQAKHVEQSARARTVRIAAFHLCDFITACRRNDASIQNKKNGSQWSRTFLGILRIYNITMAGPVNRNMAGIRPESVAGYFSIFAGRPTA